MMKSLVTPLLEKSPLLLQSGLDRCFRSSYFENSALTNKESTLPTKLEGDSRNPMIIKFDSFSPRINKSNSSQQKISIDRNFFQMETPLKKPSFFGEINTFLFNQNRDLKVEECKNLSKKSMFFTKKFINDKKNHFSVENESSFRHSQFINQNKKNINYLNTPNGITNVINIIQVNNSKSSRNPNLMIQKKRGRKPLNYNGTTSSKSKKLKKKDKTKIILYLNQIKINGVSLHKFPLIMIPEEDLNVEIFQRMLIEENYFELEDKNLKQSTIFSQEKLNKKCFTKYFLKQKSKRSSLYLVDDNEKEEDPYLIIKNYYSQIKQTVLNIQKNFIGKKKSCLNREQCDILYKLIISCNEIIDIIMNYKSIGIKKVKIIQNHNTNISELKNKSSSYQCPFCNKCFEKGQGLGGHMSRHHPKQSEKYKEKMEIRKKRTINRDFLIEIKCKFFEKYNKNYKDMLLKGYKHEANEFLSKHKLDYLIFKKKEQKKEKNKHLIKNSKDINSIIQNNDNINESSKSYSKNNRNINYFDNFRHVPIILNNTQSINVIS